MTHITLLLYEMIGEGVRNPDRAIYTIYARPGKVYAFKGIDDGDLLEDEIVLGTVAFYELITMPVSMSAKANNQRAVNLFFLGQYSPCQV